MKRTEVVVAVLLAIAVAMVGYWSSHPRAEFVLPAQPAPVEHKASPPQQPRDVLARLQSLRASVGRNPFEFEKAAPLPPGPARGGQNALTPPRQSDSTVTSPATAPPIDPPLQFYGYAKLRYGHVRAIFSHEDGAIYVSAEGDVIAGRFRVVQIGANAAVVEDMLKHTRETLTMPPGAVPS
ncbi:MAG TPA: hypothetical protein VKE70_24680 [Candidatus Solibacter sp.]|nr:hypothetical protein [Candidatus Solibacter sp.]